MKNVLLATALLVGSLEVAAHELSHGTFSGTVEFAKVTELVSATGENQEQFLVRVARELHSLTAKTGFEHCGRIGVSEDGFAVVITTNKSQIGCLVSQEVVDGYAPTALHIHSHPHVRRIRINKNDRVFLRQPTRKLNSVQNLGYEETFPDTDYNGSPGYVVTSKALMYQHGPGTARVVAEL